MKKTGMLGLRNFIHKIHSTGDMPLTTPESKRLLNAITSSFRRQLDAAHPPTVADVTEERPERSNGHPNVCHNGMHSAAALTHKHITSVLTHPLMVNGGKGFDTAKVQLQRKPRKDPIALLEEYHRKGVATIRIAELCLDHVKKAYDTAPDARKPILLDGIQPGRRVLLWLLRSNLNQSESFADNGRFLDTLVFFLLHERREENIWQLIKLDGKAPDSLEGLPDSVARSRWQEMLYSHQWRGRLLSAMVQGQIGVSIDSAPSGCIQQLRAHGLSAAIDTFVAATKLLPQMILPLEGASRFLTTLLTRRLRTVSPAGDVELAPGEKIDGERYDKLLESLPLAYPVGAGSQGNMSAEMMQVSVAGLALLHPTRPSALPFVRSLRTSFPDDRSHTVPSLLVGLKENSDFREFWYRSVLRCAVLLSHQGQNEDAAWVRGRINLFLPEHRRHAEGELRQHHLLLRESETVQCPKESSGPTHIPFPSFA
ncbi:hypothetical protein CERZMDRAFT_85961 [Cercospora zeae-maydis SCOH1-5]|uniref:Uncharacterized protein n=1 Tax=Cercospora zeae-maydis SCOH1-5 TaxID=717836 RepID=A0A6A6FB79_9PEZI|nr:hypothetical protein CERZMDRAFT_85961 [Cercospora zeae-maydis SCOH1-5]